MATASTSSTSDSPRFWRFGRTRTNVGFDLYNLLNAAPVLTLQLELQSGEHHVVDADRGAAATVLEIQRAVRLLKGST